MKQLFPIGIVFVLLVSLVLHLHNYVYYPQRGATSDEYTYSFMGVSLLTRGIPSSWSYFAPYRQTKNYDLTINHIYFWMVEPYFDHPPLNGLLVGAWALLNGQNAFEKIELPTIRLVPIALSVVTTFLIFLLGTSIRNRRTGIWAALIFASSTVMVMNTRVVFAENLLTPLFLLGIWLYSKHKTVSSRTVVFLGILAGLSFWTKEAGIAVGLSFLFLFLADRQKSTYMWTLLGFILLGVLLYAFYGMHYNAKLFWDIIRSQSNRPIGPETLLLLLAKPIIVNKVFYDGWYILGFLCLLWTFFDIKKYKLITIPALMYLLFQLTGINREGDMGWYMIPMFPFFALATAVVADETLEKRTFFVMLLSLVVGLLLLQTSYEPIFGLTPTVYRTMVLFLLGPPLAAFLFAKEWSVRKINVTWFYLLLFATMVQTYFYVHPS